MRDYLNKNDQLFCVTLTSSLNTIEETLLNEWCKDKDEVKYLKYVRTYIGKYLGNVYERIGADGFSRLEKFNDKNSLKVFPKGSPELDRVTLDVDTTLDLIEYAVSGMCDVCDLKGDAIRDCKLRHILVNAFVPILNEGEGCDYYVGCRFDRLMVLKGIYDSDREKMIRDRKALEKDYWYLNGR